MIIIHACTMIILHACIMIKVHACTMIVIQACTMIIIQTCPMIIIQACTMIIIHACTMITIHLSYIVGLVFRAVEAGGSGARSPPGKQGGWGDARPPNNDHTHKSHFTLRHQNYYRINNVKMRIAQYIDLRHRVDLKHHNFIPKFSKF